MQVNFYHGLVGFGSCFMVSQDHYRIILDVGAPFRPSSLNSNKHIYSRNNNELQDLLKSGLLSEVPGLYQGTSLDNTIVLISHLHLDHMQGMSFVKPDIPVYLTEKSYSLAKGLEKINELSPIRPYNVIKEKLQFGPFTITPIFTDHPCYGSCGYLIQTPDSTLYYSGDHRYHGANRLKAIQEIEKLAKIKIDLLLVDILTAFPDQPVKAQKEVPVGKLVEEDIYKSILSTINNSGNLAIFNIYHRDINLINSLITIADKTNRSILFEEPTAILLASITGKTYSTWDLNDAALLSSLQANPGKYFLQCSFTNSLKLSNLQTNNADYYHLFGEPFLSNGIDYSLLMTLLKKLKINYHSYQELYHFNHAYLENLEWMINTLNPQIVVPFHYSKPELLLPYCKKVRLPKEKINYNLAEGELRND